MYRVMQKTNTTRSNEGSIPYPPADSQPHPAEYFPCGGVRNEITHVMEEMLNLYGYKTRFSAGYMLLVMNGIHYQYFRHGVIYAENY